MFSLLLLVQVLANYTAVVTEVNDGDTVTATFPAFANTPFNRLGVRIAGIDTPESSKQHAKCVAEVKAGLAAKAYAKTFFKAGDTITVGYVGLDKYGGRIDGTVKLRDGRDWGQAMIDSGHAVPYTGKTKADWCAILKARKAAAKLAK